MLGIIFGVEFFLFFELRLQSVLGRCLIYCCSTEYLMNCFCNVINEWNKLDEKNANITSHNVFKNSLLSFLRLFHFDTFGIHNPAGLTVLICRPFLKINTCFSLRRIVITFPNETVETNLIVDSKNMSF